MELPMFRSLGDASPGEGMETDAPVFSEQQTPYFGEARNTAARLPAFSPSVGVGE